jgi:hypothetical protein
MLFDNLSIGLDIATALSVIAAAIAFIWNSVNSSRRESEERQKEIVRERIERRKEIIKEQVFRVVDKLIDEQIFLYMEISKIENQLRDGKTTQDLTPFRDLIVKFLYIFESRIDPIGNVYGDGRFIKLVDSYKAEINHWFQGFYKLISPDSDESWDFDIMYEPATITKKYINKLLSESEAYIESL